MDTLIIIGIGLAIVTGLCAVVYEMAEARGRHPWGWTIAALIGLFFALIGWVVVVTILALVGPTKEKKWAHYQEMAAPAR